MQTDLPYFVPLIINVFRYFLFAGGAFLICYTLFPKFFSASKIQSRLISKKAFVRDIGHSLQTTVILTLVGLLFLKTPLKYTTQIYYDLSDYAWWWLPLSILLSLILHDTYFYWMHRALHHPNLFKVIHLLHHRSANPSPWTSYSFSILEAFLESMIAPLILIFIPIHPIALVIFTSLSFMFNVYGHLGYELAPKWLRASWFFEIVNTSTHHNIHHAKSKGNYGLYFRLWDRLMATEHPDYVEAYDKIQNRRFQSKHSKSSLRKRGLLIVLAMTSLSLSPISAQMNIEGVWEDKRGGGTIQIYEEDGLYFGQLIDAEKQAEREKIKAHGKVVLLKNFRKKSSNEFCCGTIYQPREKRSISATLLLKDEKTLVIYGWYGRFTGRRIWKKYGMK